MPNLTFTDIDWIVVPGGPGLSNKYLKHGLQAPFNNFKLHYYNPSGSPESISSNTPSISELTHEFYQFAINQGLTKFGVICHSFGSYLCIRALEKYGLEKIAAVIMLNPMPFKFTQWVASLDSIINSIPSDELATIQEIGKEVNSGNKLFLEVFPYYTANDLKCPIDIPFNNAMCDKISAQISEYDDSNIIKSLTLPIIAIVGEQDKFYINNDFNIEKVVLPGVGHYPFFEDPELFSQAINNIRGYQI